LSSSKARNIEDENNVIPVQTKLLSNIEYSFNYALSWIKNAHTGLLGFFVIGGLYLLYENKFLHQDFMNIVSR